MPAPFSLRLALAWTVLATVSLWFALGTVFFALRPAGHNIVVLGLVQVAVYALVLALFHSVQGTPFAELLALRRASLGLCLAAVVLGFLIQVPATLMSDAVEHFFPTPPSVLAERVARITPHSTAQAVAILLVVAGLGPCVEELFFRGALYGALRRGHGALVTAVAVSLCFALGHVDLRLLFPLFVVALVLAQVRELSDSIWPGLALHGAFNAATLGVVFAGAAPDGRPPPMPFPMAFLGCVGSAALLYLLNASARAKRAAHVDRLR